MKQFTSHRRSRPQRRTAAAARSQYSRRYGSGSYTRTLKSQYQVSEATSADTTTSTAPGPRATIISGRNGSIGDRVAGLSFPRAALGINPFASFSIAVRPGEPIQLWSFSLANPSAAESGRADRGRKPGDAGQGHRAHRSARADILDVTQAVYDAALADRLVTITESSYKQTGGSSSRRSSQEGGRSLSSAAARTGDARQSAALVISGRATARLRISVSSSCSTFRTINRTLTTPSMLRHTSRRNSPRWTDSVRLLSARTQPARTARFRQAAEQWGAASQVRIARSQLLRREPHVAIRAVAYPTSGLPSSGEFRTNWTIGLATQVRLPAAHPRRREGRTGESRRVARTSSTGERVCGARCAGRVNSLNRRLHRSSSRGPRSRRLVRTPRGGSDREGISSARVERLETPDGAGNREPALAARNLQVAP